MVDHKGDTTKKQPSPKDPLEESSETRHHQHHHHHQIPPPIPVIATGAPFITPPIYVPSGGGGATTTTTTPSSSSPSPFETSVNPKRPRYGTGQWKLLPSPSTTPSSQQQQQIKGQKHTTTTTTQIPGMHSTESSPSPTNNPPPPPSQQQQQQQPQPRGGAVSSSDTASSSPSLSPIPSLSAASGQDTNKSEPDQTTPFNPHHHQFRRGKYVSPVWKPNEMLWLARAWRAQYQNGSGFGSGSTSADVATTTVTPPGRGKTRADKDREVAEFLSRHGVNRDAKTAGTKWDNMLGEFRKVYEWERSGGERESIGKSYFRLSPYERKLHRLPASFDEEVFDELSQFMGSRMRSSPTLTTTTSSSQSRGPIGVGGGSSIILTGGEDSRVPPPHHHHHHHQHHHLAALKALPPPPLLPSIRDIDDISLSCARAKQLAMTNMGDPLYYHGSGSRGSLLGYDTTLLDVVPSGGPSTSSSTISKELRRIGKIRMIWEESVSLWGSEEGEHHNRGRVKISGSSFLNADQLTFLDESMVACTMEAFEDGNIQGFSVDTFLSGQQVKVFGRKSSSSASIIPPPPPPPPPPGFTERVQLPLTEPSIRSIPPWEFQDPTEYFVGCLRVPPTTLPTLFELSWHLQEPPPEDLRFPLRKDVYRDLPQGKELFFTTSTEPLDCRSITYDILSSIIRSTPSITASTAMNRDSFIGLWDDCINRIVSKFCSIEMIIVRKPSPSSSPSSETLQDQWPNVTGFVRNFCLWRGEETDQLRDGQSDPSSSIVEKLLWTYIDLPYILGYYAVGYLVTFCALSRLQDRVIRTDLYSLDLSTPTERLKALIPCLKIAGLLPLLADQCFNNNNNNNNYKVFPIYSDFERIDMGNGNIIEMSPNTTTRYFSSTRKWAAVKEIYDFLDHRIPHAECITRSSEKDLAIVFKPRGCRTKPTNCEQLIEALKYVTKALVALHDLSFMHRDLGWDKVMRRNERENEWFVCGFDDAVGSPQIYPHYGAGGNGGGGGGTGTAVAVGSGRHAPEMGRGVHGVKVDVWGVGQLVKTCGIVTVPKMLKDLQNRCLEQNPELRPTAADCYHHLLQLQSSMHSAAAASSAGGGY